MVLRSLHFAGLAAALIGAAAVASAFTEGQADRTIPVGQGAVFVGTGWRCVNHSGYLTCQHGADRLYVDLTSRHAGNFIVTVHPVAGRVGAPMKSRQAGDPIPVYSFSSTLK